MKRSIYFEIGHTSLGNPVSIPLGGSSEKLKKFLDKYSIPEQMDIFCLTEFLTQKAVNSYSESIEAELTKRVFEIVYQMFKEGLFQRQLMEKNLPTSAARVIYGKQLCHIAYR